MKETRQHGTLNFEQGLEMLLQSEVDDRESKRYDRLKKNAAFRYQASIEEINMDATRGIDHSLITDLATGVIWRKPNQSLSQGQLAVENLLWPPLSD